MSLLWVPPIVASDTRFLREIPEHEKSPALPLVQMSGPTLSGGGGGGGGGVGVGGDGEGGGGAAPPPPPPQATQNAVKLNTQRNLAKAFMPFVQVWRQPGGLGVLREVFHGFSEEARTRGFPPPSLGGFGFVGVIS